MTSPRSETSHARYASSFKRSVLISRPPEKARCVRSADAPRNGRRRPLARTDLHVLIARWGHHVAMAGRWRERSRAGNVCGVERNALILGCGRSGTSIFGELFEMLPSFDYFEEPVVDEIPARPVRPIAVKVPRLPEGVSAPAGCALSDELLARIPAEPRTTFWQVRHPYDAVCSLRVGIADGWGHHPRPPDWQQWLQRPLVERCAHHWATINTLGYRQVAQIAIVNRFEDMIQDPPEPLAALPRRSVLTVGQHMNRSLPGPGACGTRTTICSSKARMSRRRSRPTTPGGSDGGVRTSRARTVNGFNRSSPTPQRPLTTRSAHEMPNCSGGV